MLIEKAPLDSFLGGGVTPEASETLTPVVQRDAKRPGLNFQAMVDRLLVWEAEGSLPEIKRGWREKVCRRLLAENLNWYPTAQTPKPLPKIRTIKKVLKDELDAIEQRSQQGR